MIWQSRDGQNLPVVRQRAQRRDAGQRAVAGRARRRHLPVGPALHGLFRLCAPARREAAVRRGRGARLRWQQARVGHHEPAAPGSAHRLGRVVPARHRAVLLRHADRRGQSAPRGAGAGVDRERGAPPRGAQAGAGGGRAEGRGREARAGGQGGQGGARGGGGEAPREGRRRGGGEGGGGADHDDARRRRAERGGSGRVRADGLHRRGHRVRRYPQPAWAARHALARRAPPAVVQLLRPRGGGRADRRAHARGAKALVELRAALAVARDELPRVREGAERARERVEECLLIWKVGGLFMER